MIKKKKNKLSIICSASYHLFFVGRNIIVVGLFYILCLYLPPVVLSYIYVNLDLTRENHTIPKHHHPSENIVFTIIYVYLFPLKIKKTIQCSIADTKSCAQNTLKSHALLRKQQRSSSSRSPIWNPTLIAWVPPRYHF